ncbi:hypothetical protein RB595_002985 [Gaeumannomyces hyphopodioides]
MAQQNTGGSRSGYYNHEVPTHSHLQASNGDLVMAQDCDNPDCSMRTIYQGQYHCGSCNNERVIWVPCGCPPDPSVQTIAAYVQGSAPGGPSQDRRNDNGRNGDGGGGKGKVRRQGGNHRVGST